MASGGRSGQPPTWLIVLISVVATLGIVTVVHRFFDDHRDSKSGSASSGQESGPPTANLTSTTAQGSARSVEVSGQIELTSISVDLGTNGWFVTGAEAPLSGTGTVTVQAPELSVDVFRTVITPSSATFAPTSSIVPLPDGALVNDTAVRGKSVQLNLSPTAAITWLDPPATITVAHSEQFSWAGSGEIVVDGQSLTGEFLGAYGSMTVTLTRAADAIGVTATGGVQQAFVEGQPVLRTTATVERIRTDISMHRGDPTQGTYVTWAPRTTGRFAACITKISPQSGHAEWVNVGLQSMPPMFGGEDHAKVGGDTTGLGDTGTFFGGADAIDSLIRVGDADRRDLSITVPQDTPPGTYPIEIAIEGNFDSVVFAITVTVLE